MVVQQGQRPGQGRECFFSFSHMFTVRWFLVFGGCFCFSPSPASKRPRRPKKRPSGPSKPRSLNTGRTNHHVTEAVERAFAGSVEAIVIGRIEQIRQIVVKQVHIDSIRL